MAPPQIVVVTLTPEEWAIFNRPINAERVGGHQRLLYHLHQRANQATRRVTITPQDMEKLRRYTAAYGTGGYQDRFRAVLSAVAREEGNGTNRGLAHSSV
jgi:carotenoid cleavage dioxygenase-like enzyme